MNPHHQTNRAKLYRGDCRTVLPELPADSVQAIITSPPYWGKRSYPIEATMWGGSPTCRHKWTERVIRDARGLGVSGLEGGPNHHRSDHISASCSACGAWRGQLGHEPDPRQFVDHLIGVFEACRRVLRPDGLLWVVIQDSHLGSGAHKAHHQNAGLSRAADRDADIATPVPEGMRAKSLAGVPARLQLGMMDLGWICRQVVIWHKRASTPESVLDRPTTDYEHILMFSREPRYFWDQVEALEPIGAWHGSDGRYGPNGTGRSEVLDGWTAESSPKGPHRGFRRVDFSEGRNLRAVWTLNPDQFEGQHYATFPRRLVRRLISLSTSAQGCCPSCGTCWIRTRKDRTWRPGCGCGSSLRPGDLEVIQTPTGSGGIDPTMSQGRAGMKRTRTPDQGTRPITRYQQRRYAEQLKASPHRATMAAAAGKAFEHYIRTDRTAARPIPPKLLQKWIGLGYLERVELPEQTPPTPVPCLVLDPFVGTGTTMEISRDLGRHSIGIEASDQYLQMAIDRIGQAVLPYV